MSKRVIEIARDLGLASTELVSRIKELELPFGSVDATAVLTEEQVGQLTEALEQSKTEPEKKLVSKGVIRRRSKTARRKVVGEDVEPAEAAEEPPAATPRVRKKIAPVAEEPAEPAEVAAEPEIARARFETVVRREEEEAELPAAELEPVAEVEPPVDEPLDAVAEVAPRRPRMETVVHRQAAKEDAPADAETELVDAEAVATEDDAVAEPAKRRRFETVQTRAVGAESDAPRDEALSPMERAAIARREADALSDGSRAGAARVVGTVNPDLLTTRLEADRKDFSPGVRRPRGAEEEKKTKKKGKRVVQSRDLYDRGGRGRKKGRPVKGSGQQTKITQAAEHKRVVRMEEAILVGELAQQMAVKAGELVMKLAFELGMKGANINTAIDFDTATLVVEIYEYKVEQVGFDLSKYLPQIDEDESRLRPRPPVVTVMGHVDHGKTSLLDAIRSTAVIDGEAGGITQHIGAYTVVRGGREICFLDTPGHEAFTALRARGARATDIVILVVAADDGVMPQTVEAINHARDAEVPIIVAINKIDKPGANVDRIRQALTEYELVPEDWGGDTLFAEISALKGTGIDELLETLNLQAEVMELQADPDRPAEGIVIESKLDVGRGPVATILVQHGTLNSGDIVAMGTCYGRVRTMTDEFGKVHKSAPPSTPVEITGINGVPDSGEQFYVVKDEKDARTISEHVSVQAKQIELAQSFGSGGGMERISEMLRAGEIKELKLIVKADVQGSAEAVTQALTKLSTEKVAVRIIHSAVGSITESDVNLAASNDAAADSGVVIVGFNVKPEARAQTLAEQNGVSIITQTVIYDIIDRIKIMMVGLLDPVYIEEFLGRAEVREIFRVPRLGTIAGCMVTDGVIQRNAKARLMRDGVAVAEANIESLRHFNEDKKEMRAGFECGLSMERVNDIQVGDLVECYKLKETTAVL